MATGIALPFWAIPVALLAWGLLWTTTFSFIENGVSLLGLVTVAFAVGVVKLHPDYGALAHGLVPTMPRQDSAHYWFIAVSVLGASISPYLYYFYSSGAIEEKWDVTYIATNRAIAAIGMGFGGFLSLAVLVLAALLFHPRGIDVQHYQQLPELLSGVFGRTGFWLVIASLAIACIGATLEIALSLAYLVAQGFGWNWGEDLKPRDDARFALTYTVLIFASALFALFGADPLKLTEISMSLTAASLPLATFPFLILMNDRDYLGEHTNGHVGNAVVLFISALSAVLGVVSIPLELIGGRAEMKGHGNCRGPSPRGAWLADRRKSKNSGDDVAQYRTVPVGERSVPRAVPVCVVVSALESLAEVVTVVARGYVGPGVTIVTALKVERTPVICGRSFAAVDLPSAVALFITPG